MEEDTDLDTRLALLLRLKFILREFDCELTREAVRLADEEADLMSRGRPASSLVGLRKRLQNSFLTFCETPEFNPAVQALPDADKLIYRPETLPLSDATAKLSQPQKEALARLKNNQTKKAAYGQVDRFRKQFGTLGLSGLLRQTEEQQKLTDEQPATNKLEFSQEILREDIGADEEC